MEDNDASRTIETHPEAQFHFCTWDEPCDFMYKKSIREVLETYRVVIFGKTNCQYTDKIKNMFSNKAIAFHAFYIDQSDEGLCFQATLLALTKKQTLPLVFINNRIIGGAETIRKLMEEHKLLDIVRGPSPDEEYMFDVIVVGGGSGGLASAKEAADNGLHVACLDFVSPSPAGSTWGLGGTCVNVGCIPKKLMHTAAVIGEEIHDALEYGWDVKIRSKHDWVKLRQAVQDYIGSLNWNYRTQLRSKHVKYFNSTGKFVGPHKIIATNKKGKSEELTARHFIVATGGRPRYPHIPGCPEYCVSSDDIFSLPYPPGKTIVIGASYVALECAGFLAGLGYEVLVMVRSVLLRGFDQQCAELIGDCMNKLPNLRFLRPCIPTKIEKVTDDAPAPPVYKVHGQMNDGSEICEECNTVLMAIGREPCTKNLGFETVGVKINPFTGKVLHQPDESTTCPYIYCIGDVLDDKPELTPTAIHAGRLLARRIVGKTNKLTDYINVPTTVFTPLEYGCIGLSEEEALGRYGEKGVEIYHSYYVPLEWSILSRDKNYCYAKLICSKSESNRVIGFHITGPNAGEITQGFTLPLKAGLTKDAFDDTIGIHPTCAEIFTSLTITKSSKLSPAADSLPY